MKYIDFNSIGEIVARYDSEMHGLDVPESAIEVSDEFFFRTINETDGVWRRDQVTGDIVKHTFPPAAPKYKTKFSVLEFRYRFTIDEQLAIRQAQFNDMEVGLVYDSFQAAQFIDIEDSRVAQGIDLYISKGLLNSNRKSQLLEPELML